MQVDWGRVFELLDEKVWSNCPSCRAGRFYSWLGGIAFHLALFGLMSVLLFGHVAVVAVVFGIGGFAFGWRSKRMAAKVAAQIKSEALEKFRKDQEHVDAVLNSIKTPDGETEAASANH